MKDKHVREETERTNVSRRKFLTRLGMGTAAGAIALPKQLGEAIAGPRTVGSTEAVAPKTGKFSRLFPDLPAFVQATAQVQAALMEIGKPGGILDAKDVLTRGPLDLIVDAALNVNNRNNETQTAGTTFLGQFLDHDMTFDTTSQLGKPTKPEETSNARTPAFDLDSIYGGGPVSNPVLYDSADRDKFRIESGGLFEDLPRSADGTAIIADPRNDENMIIAGLHAAFLLFHNRVVDLLRSQGRPRPRIFPEAQQLVRWHYQWIIVNEFLPQIIGQSLVQDILTNGRRFYKPRPNEQSIPVEFQGAVYRFGHSQVRPSYRANLAGNNDQPFFAFIFDPAAANQADPIDLRGRARAPRRFIGWQTFFDFGDGQVRPNKRIDTKISTPLFQLPLSAIPSADAPTSLAQRNLLRHLTWSLPSGQEVARTMGLTPLQPSQLSELVSFGLGLERNTPLWYYVLKEAELATDGLLLGSLGGRIVGEVFIGLLELDKDSYLANNRQWKPTLPSRTPGAFRMVDLLTFARVDPRSRGQ